MTIRYTERSLEEYLNSNSRYKEESQYLLTWSMRKTKESAKTSESPLLLPLEE
jgi:hypothetical protein